MRSWAARRDEGALEGSRISGIARALVALGVGVVAFTIAMFLAPWQVATLLGWDVTAAVFIAWVLLRIVPLDSAATARLATVADDSRIVAEITLISASGASLIGVGLALLHASGEQGGAKALITAVASAAVILSWAVVHTVFTLRYAHLYYLTGSGIHFNEERAPDYGDFAYLAFTIGMTYQVSDTVLTDRRIRMTALRHALLSFVFGTGVLATMINVVAGLFKT